MVDLPDSNPVSESNRARRHARDLRAWQLKAEKKKLGEIREILVTEGFGDIKETTISSAIHRVDAENRDGMHETIAVLRMRMAHFNDYVAGQAIAAWEKSKNPAVVKKSRLKVNGIDGKAKAEVVQDEDGNDVEVEAHDGPDFSNQYQKDKSRTTTYRDGDPRYLAIALQATAANAKLLGLEQPKQINMTVDQNSETLAVQRRIDEATKDLSVDEIRALSELANKIVETKRAAQQAAIDVEYRQLPDKTDD